MNFLQETGAIITKENTSLAYFDGTTGHVDFDIELIIKLHKASSGCIYKFAHTHPLRMNAASGTDRMMLRTLVPALYPFPVRLSVITSLSVEYPDWREVTYMATMESKEEWKKSEREFREIKIIEESTKTLWESDFPWLDYLLDKSYEV